jgi:basic amino acid/polyamine antiporter, APA family
MPGNFFRRKTLKMLHEEMNGENRLRRVLGPWSLTSLGIGCIIGAGIFVVTGYAAHYKAGQALPLSFVVAGLACVFSARVRQLQGLPILMPTQPWANSSHGS